MLTFNPEAVARNAGSIVQPCIQPIPLNYETLSMYLYFACFRDILNYNCLHSRVLLHFKSFLVGWVIKSHLYGYLLIHTTRNFNVRRFSQIQWRFFFQKRFLIEKRGLDEHLTLSKYRPASDLSVQCCLQMPRGNMALFR